MLKQKSHQLYDRSDTEYQISRRLNKIDRNHLQHYKNIGFILTKEMNYNLLRLIDEKLNEFVKTLNGLVKPAKKLDNKEGN